MPRPRLFRLSATRELVDIVVLVVAIYALVNLTSVRFIVRGPSMQPNFYDNQYLIVSRLSYTLGEPERGDIVVFHYPGNITEDYIKRVIALPGDTVEVSSNRIYVNGEELTEGYLKEPCLPTRCRDQGLRELGPNEYWVMGDNRNHSRDSREFGPILREAIVGEVLFRYWPPADWGTVNRINFSGD